MNFWFIFILFFLKLHRSFLRTAVNRLDSTNQIKHVFKTHSVGLWQLWSHLKLKSLFPQQNNQFDRQAPPPLELRLSRCPVRSGLESALKSSAVTWDAAEFKPASCSWRSAGNTDQCDSHRRCVGTANSWCRHVNGPRWGYRRPPVNTETGCRSVSDTDSGCRCSAASYNHLCFCCAFVPILWEDVTMMQHPQHCFYQTLWEGEGWFHVMIRCWGRIKASVNLLEIFLTFWNRQPSNLTDFM